MSMSMYKFVFKLQDGEKIPCTPKAALLLPDPKLCSSPDDKRLFTAANREVNKVLSLTTRGKYNKLDDSMRKQIALKCIDIVYRLLGHYI